MWIRITEADANLTSLFPWDNSFNYPSLYFQDRHQLRYRRCAPLWHDTGPNYASFQVRQPEYHTHPSMKLPLVLIHHTSTKTTQTWYQSIMLITNSPHPRHVFICRTDQSNPHLIQRKALEIFSNCASKLTWPSTLSRKYNFIIYNDEF